MVTLYVARPIGRQNFSKEKNLTVPNQSMSLKDILNRFIRRESLPVQKNGIYNDQLGDLEKMATEDVTIQMDRVNDLRTKIREANARMKQKAIDERDALIKAEVEKQNAATLAKANDMAKSAGGTGAASAP